MAVSAEAAGFWLPSEFLDDFVVGKENLIKNNPTESDSEFCFPNEFPYDFGTKNEKLLEKRWVMSTSPQSTLCQSWAGRSAGGSTNGSPNGFPSPPTTPKTNAVGDLVYHAAGQVERLKLHGGGGVGGPTKVKTFLAPPRSLDQLHRDPSVAPNIYLQQQMVKQRQQMYPVRPGQHAWPVERNPTRVAGRAAVFVSGGGGGGAAVKSGCAGTGVFLPRRYGNGNNNNNNNNKNIINNNICNAYASDSRNKQGYSAAYIPKRNFHGLNKNFENMTGFVQPQPHYQPKLGRGFVPEYDLMMARRNALMLQHQRSSLLEGSSPMNRSVYLPQEWTY